MRDWNYDFSYNIIFKFYQKVIDFIYRTCCRIFDWKHCIICGALLDCFHCIPECTDGITVAVLSEIGLHSCLSISTFHALKYDSRFLHAK